MFANDAARLIGITPRALRRFMRETGRNQSELKGARYEFTHEEVNTIAAEYWGTRKRGKVTEEDDHDDSAPGLSLADLNNPNMREQFRKLRKEREARLQASLRNAGLSLPQLSDDYLVRTGMAMSLEAVS